MPGAKDNLLECAVDVMCRGIKGLNGGLLQCFLYFLGIIDCVSRLLHTGTMKVQLPGCMAPSPAIMPKWACFFLLAVSNCGELNFSCHTYASDIA